MRAGTSRSRHAFGQAVGVLALSLGATGLAPVAVAEEAAVDPVSAATVNAVWVEREFSFAYMGIGTYYSCDGLRNKVEYVLEQVGARKEPKVTVSCFDRNGGVDFMPMARIRVAVPAEATPELLQQLASDQSRRELVGRVQGKGKPVDDVSAQFPAQRRVVEFDGHRGKRIEDGDCQLLEQLLPQVLKPLGVRELPGSSLRCVPRQAQLGAVNLRLEALHAVTPAADGKGTPGT